LCWATRLIQWLQKSSVRAAIIVSKRTIFIRVLLHVLMHLGVLLVVHCIVDAVILFAAAQANQAPGTPTALSQAHQTVLRRETRWKSFSSRVRERVSLCRQERAQGVSAGPAPEKSRPNSRRCTCPYPQSQRTSQQSFSYHLQPVLPASPAASHKAPPPAPALSPQRSPPPSAPDAERQRPCPNPRLVSGTRSNTTQ